MRRLIRDPRLRAGFTLIELLVVIAIIGVLVALIMPAVQAAREAARRTQCLNNLRQLGVGSHQYHDSFSSLPSGWFCEPYTTGCSNQGATDYQWSGLTSLLLQVEQEALYGEINFEVQPYTPENRTVISRTLAAFVCPSNRKPEVVTKTVDKVTYRVGPSDYRGNMAAGQIPNCTDPVPANCFIYDNGVTFLDSQVGLDKAGIPDGTSTTLLYGESLTGDWSGAKSCCVRTTTDRTINRPIVVSGQQYFTYWSSKHPSSVNFAKCDGSVSTITQGINKQVLIKLMTRNGGEVISSDEIK